MKEFPHEGMYKTDGRTLFTHADGKQEIKPWNGLAIENRDNFYHVYRYGDGKVYFAHNCERVNELPKTKLTKILLEEWSKES